MDACLEWAFISLPLAPWLETFHFQLCKMGGGGKGALQGSMGVYYADTGLGKKVGAPKLAFGTCFQFLP